MFLFVSIPNGTLVSGINDAAHIADMTIASPSPAETTSSLERYLAEISDPVLRENLAREIGGLKREFGLVFERHHPEGIRLPKHTVKRGSKVVISGSKNSVFYRVHRLNKETSTAIIVDADGNQSEHLISSLTVAKEFGDVMYPGLRKLSEIHSGDPDAPVHTIINGENYHALEALQYTHAGKVDLIYIDPPYNTGNADWKYNDRYVDAKDGYRHSKWLSFMEKRLSIAKVLLRDSGSVMLSIDNNEHHRVRSLLDQVFGETNFVADISRIQGSGGRQNTHFRNRLDFVLVYAKNKDLLPPFSEPVSDEYRELFKNIEDDGRRYKTEPLFKTQLGSVGRKSMRYYIECPDGSLCIPPGKVFPSAKREGDLVTPKTHDDKIWRWSYETFDGRRDEIVFKQTKTSPLVDEHGNKSSWNVHAKQYLGEEQRNTPEDFITDSPNANGTADLRSLGLSTRFNFPKPVSLIHYLVQVINNPHAVVLDFFGGSGTTAEAVIRLNAEDGGTRQAILVTNNELSKADDARLRKAGHVPGDDEYEALGVFQHVTKPRLESVVSGILHDGTEHSAGLDANIAFFELTYLDEPDIVRGAAFNDLAGLFWLKAGGYGRTVELNAGAKSDGFAISESGRTAVLFTPGRARALSEKLTHRAHQIDRLFIVTDSPAQGDEAATHFRDGITVERIYGSYLEAFQVNRKD